MHSFFSNDEVNIEVPFLFHTFTFYFKVPTHEALSDGSLLSSISRAYSNYQCSQLADPEEKFAGALEKVDQKISLLLSSCEVCYNFNVI